MALQAKILSFFEIAHVQMKQTKTFCETESVIKLYLKIADNFLHGWMHAMNWAEKLYLGLHQRGPTTLHLRAIL